ncbi:speckle targeted PIP5K1A-regulated poly(A) polymerase-like [Planococcus citri]|uniref:speckle targeted PIP5K1A-regulated poly(A) polymerase-like n=1 Tax=Planococcus citri TaxID=170843 RepID=UPI0031FA3E7C
MDSQRKLRLQKEILSELELRGLKNWTVDAKSPDKTLSRIDFELPAALSSFEYPTSEIEMEIVDIVNEISLPEYEASEILQSVTSDLNMAFESIDIPLDGEYVAIANDWHLYGSYRNGLCCNDSDIDFHNGSFENLTNSDAGYLVKTIWEVFENNTYFDPIRYFETARVPLVELKHRRTGKICSITFSGEMGEYDSLLAKLYLEQYSDLKVLTLFLKYVLVRHGLHGTRKITTHTLFWLLVFFMQQKKMLLPVKDVREKNDAQNGNYSFPDCYPEWRQTEYSSEESIVSLYHGFLEFYKNFNFLKYVISPYFGYALPIDNSVTLSKLLFTRSCMNIQDMSTLTTNLAANVSLKAVNEFRVVCEHLFKNCENALYEGYPFEISSKSELKSMKHLYKNINQTASIDLDYVSLGARLKNDLKQYSIDAVSNLMEMVLRFEYVNGVSCNIIWVNRKQGDPVRNRVPVLYIEYRTTYATLSNKHMLSMFEESSSCLSEKFGVFFLFDIHHDLKCVKVLVEGDGRFVDFMKTHGKKLFIDQV